MGGSHERFVESIVKNHKNPKWLHCLKISKTTHYTIDKIGSLILEADFNDKNIPNFKTFVKNHITL